MSAVLKRDDLARVDREIVGARGLPSSVYTGKDWAAAERETVLGQTWTCIGLARDVEPRHALPVTLLGAPLVMIRDADRQVRVFHNVCRHRGYRLVPEPCRIEGAVRCPYHSWTYALDGRLRGTPHIGGPGVHEVDGFDRGAHGLHEIRSAEWLGLIFVNLSGDAPAFEDHVAPLVARWEHLVGPGGFDALRPAPDGARMELTVQSNWKLAVENYCESYHLPWVHPGLNSYSKLEDHYHIIDGERMAGQGTRAFNFAAREDIELPSFPDWPADQRNIAEYIALFPNVLLGLQMDHHFAIVLQPIAHDCTREIVEILYVGDEAVSPAYAAARQRTLEGWREVFAEDVHAVEGMQAGRASTAFDGGAFSPVMDNPTHHFHRWVARRLPGESA